MSAALAIERAGDAEQFLEMARDWLLAAEAENNLLLGMALDWCGRRSSDSRPYWLVVRDAQAIVACACRTPPYPLVLSRAPAGAVAALADHLSATDTALTGVNGPTAEAEAFAAAWTARHGAHHARRFSMRLLELTEIAPALPARTGSLRLAEPTDLVLASDWVKAYVRDVGLHTPMGDLARRLIERRQLFFWADDGEARSMVAATRDTGSGCSINTVYTPPIYRGSGYATAAVAALSRRLLAAGRRFCCLYTDAANPTSNSIYAKIGYRPIRDDAEIAFDT